MRKLALNSTEKQNRQNFVVRNDEKMRRRIISCDDSRELPFSLSLEPRDMSL